MSDWIRVADSTAVADSEDSESAGVTFFVEDDEMAQGMRCFGMNNRTVQLNTKVSEMKNKIARVRFSFAVCTKAGGATSSGCRSGADAPRR